MSKTRTMTTLILTLALVLTALVGVAPAAAQTDYQISITMNEATIDALHKGKYFLYAFKAVAGGAGGVPTVWFSLPATDLTANTTISWQEDYKAYVSETEITSGVTILSANDTPINLGQTWEVKEDGFGPVVTGAAGEIGVESISSKAWTTGIEQEVNGQFNILCAFPLYGNQTDSMTPIEKVLLLFATQPINTGTVIESAISSSTLVDLTGVESRSISFDINGGWSCDNYSWCTMYPPNQDIQKVLIDDSNDRFDPAEVNDTAGSAEGTCYSKSSCRGDKLGTYEQNKCYSKSIGGKSWKASSGNCYNK